jgi:hypothetical protein
MADFRGSTLGWHKVPSCFGRLGMCRNLRVAEGVKRPCFLCRRGLSPPPRRLTGIPKNTLFTEQYSVSAARKAFRTYIEYNISKVRIVCKRCAAVVARKLYRLNGCIAPCEMVKYIYFK